MLVPIVPILIVRVPGAVLHLIQILKVIHNVIYIYICFVFVCGFYDRFKNRMTRFNSKKSLYRSLKKKTKLHHSSHYL